jgi:hypothetical protein
MIGIVVSKKLSKEVLMSKSFHARIDLLNKILSHSGYIPNEMVKVAFDTRRINQNTEYNPRRNLQYYVREQPFIADQDTMKITALSKLKMVSDDIKNDFIGEPEWFDTYASDLDHHLTNTFFKSDGKNYDFSPTHIQYLEQLLSDRYRIKLADIVEMPEKHLKAMIIHRDEKLEKSNIYKAGDLSKINKQKVVNIVKEPEPVKREIKTKSASSGIILDLMGSILADEKVLEDLRIESIALDKNISQKKIDLQVVQQDKSKYQEMLMEKVAQEKQALRKLWADHHALQKVITSKKGLEELISINSNYQPDSLKLFANLSNDIKTFTNNMIKERPIYDAINAEKQMTEKLLKDKIELEKKANQEIVLLQEKLNHIANNRTIIRKRIKENIEEINQLKMIEK